MLRLAAVILVAVLAAPLSAATIDTSGSWDGSVNEGWLGSGQSLTVDLVESRLDSIGFYFDDESSGLVFDFSIADAPTGGSTFFSSSLNVVSGFNLIVTGLNLAPGSLVYALFDYRGFEGRTAQFTNLDPYGGGNSLFFDALGVSNFADLDHRFIASFSNPTVVPLPAGAVLLLTGMAGLIGLRKLRQRSVARA